MFQLPEGRSWNKDLYFQINLSEVQEKTSLVVTSEEPTSSTFSCNSVHHEKDGNVTESNNCSVLHPTAIVSVLNSKDQLIPCRALLDSGSQLSFITQALSRRLNLNITEKHLNVSGFGGQSNDVKAGLANMVLKSVSNEIRVSAYILTTYH